MSKRADSSIIFIEEAIKTGRALGFSEVTAFLIELRKTESTASFKDKIDVIINEVLLDFSMTKKRLFESRSHDGTSRIARQFCYKLMQSLLELDANSIGSIFKKSPPTIWREIRLFNELDRKNKIDIEVLNRYDTIHKKILNKIIE